MNDEYKGLFAPPIPEKIEFSKEKDTPLEDLENILKLKSEQRQNEIHEYFKEEQKIGGVVELATAPVPREESTPIVFENPELVLHRRILESILKAQIKIIDMLQRK